MTAPPPNLVGTTVPELAVPTWVDAQGDPAEPLRLHDLHTPLAAILCFRCDDPASDAAFDDLVRLRTGLAEQGYLADVTMAAIQCVHGHRDENTVEAALATLRRHDLMTVRRTRLYVALGRDDGQRSTMRSRFGIATTPSWILVGPDRRVLFEGDHLNIEPALDVMGRIIENPALATAA